MPILLFVPFGGQSIFFGGILMPNSVKKPNGKDPLVSTKALLAMGGTPEVLPTGNVCNLVKKN